jgi:nicotinamidase/pyrazinamidase
MSTPTLGPHDAVIAVDVQRDFCSGGHLAIAGGDEVVPVLNAWIEAARAARAVVVASRDWHPPDHISFHGRAGPWAPHCIQQSAGAAFHPHLQLPPDAVVVSKGEDPDTDQYSAFDRTGLASVLRDRGVQRVWIGGLAQDVCVRATVLDACREGFATHLIAHATRPIEARSGEIALSQMQNAGAKIVDENLGR